MCFSKVDVLGDLVAQRKELMAGYSWAYAGASEPVECDALKPSRHATCLEIITYQEEDMRHPLRRALERKIEIQERSRVEALRVLRAKRRKKKGPTTRQRFRATTTTKVISWRRLPQCILENWRTHAPSAWLA